MTDPRLSGALHPEEREALEEVANTPFAAPSPRARERARSAFLTGSAEARPARARLRFLVPLSFAAALLLVSWFGFRPVTGWSVWEANNASLEQADILEDRPLAEGDRFVYGIAMTELDGSLDVQLGDRLRLQITPGSRIEIPPAPGRWFGSPRLLRVESGEVFAATADDGLGFELVVESAETRTTVRGTTFAVRCNEDGTCVCLLRGSLVVDSADDVYRVDVPTGMRVQFFTDGRPPMTAPLTSVEREKLAALRVLPEL